MKRILPIAGAALMVCGATTSIQAASINYELTGNTYSYTVNNNSSNPLTDFIIFFPDVSSSTAFNYTLGEATEPLGWTSAVSQPSAIDLGGYVEWYSTTGIVSGGSLGGFSAQFSYSGVDTPSSRNSLACIVRFFFRRSF